jgi:hypothetical protein
MVNQGLVPYGGNGIKGQSDMEPPPCLFLLLSVSSITLPNRNGGKKLDDEWNIIQIFPKFFELIQ